MDSRGADTPSNGRQWLVVIGLSVASLLVWLQTTVFSSVESLLTADFNPSKSSLDWAVNIYTLTGASLLVFGRVCDQYGSRRVFMIGAGTLTAGLFVTALAPAMAVVTVGRGISGLGAAIVLPAILSLLALQKLPPAQLRMAFALFAACSWGGSLLGPTAGLLLSPILGWRGTVGSMIPLMLATLLLVRLSNEARTVAVNERLDYPGLFLLVAGLFLLVYPLIMIPSRGLEPLLALMLVSSIAMFVVFILVEKRQRSPLIDLGIFRNMRVVGGSSITFIQSFAIVALLVMLPVFIQQVLGYSAGAAALILVPLSASVIIFSPVGIVLAKKIGVRNAVTFGMACVILSFMILATVGNQATYTALLLPFVLFGFGVGLSFSAAQMDAMTAVTDDEAGLASGVFNQGSMIGTLLGTVAVSAIFQFVMTGQLEDKLPSLDPGVALAVTTDFLANTPTEQSVRARANGSQVTPIVEEVKVAATEGLKVTSWSLAGISLLGLGVGYLTLSRKGGGLGDDDDVGVKRSEAELTE